MRKYSSMSQAETQVLTYRFGDFSLDARNRELRRGGELVPLNSKYFEVLLLLVSNGGNLVEKQRIFDEVWEGVFVTDAALTQCIKDIRRQLGDDAANPRYIKTVPKHGYIFIGNALATTVERNGGAQAVAPAAPRPYKFLDYYTEQDAQLFFGREEEIEIICSQILARRTFILHGRSGVGKSSIVRAGLMPRLKSQGHLVFPIRSFTDPVQQMAQSLRACADAPPESDAGLERLISQAVNDSPERLAVFFLDQFEEFFSLLAAEKRGHFLRTIGNLIAREDLPLRLAFVLREDLLAEMSLLKPVVPEIFHHEYRLKRLSRGQAARAIVEPAKAAGCRYEPALVDLLLDDLSEQDNIDPPQLQIVCDNLYDARTASGILSVEAYRRLGAASQILAGYLERVLRRFNHADLRAAREILTTLISADGQRLVLRETELRARVRGRLNAASSPEALIEELVAARVVRRRSQDGEAWLELAHDFLTPEVSRWLTAEDRALKQARGVIERAMENYRQHQLIIDADALDLLLPFGEELGLTGAETDLLALSALTRARRVPDWLARTAPSMRTLILDAARHEDKDVRLCAVEACRLWRSEETESLLRRLSLWDRDLAVRKAASIAIADLLQADADKFLARDSQSENAGTIRRAISLAMIRDYNKQFIDFTGLSAPTGLLVILALAWVRLRRGGQELIREGIGGTLGGAFSGTLGGFLLGLSLSIARHSPAPDAFSLILVLMSIGAFIGGIGGFGVSFGMIAASRITYRHSRFWAVVGGAAGGALVGGSSNLLGVDTLKALFGQNPVGLTGAFEGAMIGAGVSLGA
ncbi:MAG TPA: winged helix-turn-helix domain-containing protein, partial [Blastocatellia bacterium]|nr:winged helix-turn-helix domain-containing protein [Blastocatellia bacterium]